jgi:hypothetical protein
MVGAPCALAGAILGIGAHILINTIATYTMVQHMIRHELGRQQSMKEIIFKQMQMLKKEMIHVGLMRKL